jgi:serpin B
MYFNAAWLLQFEKSATRDGGFLLADGTRVTVPMMRQGASFRVGAGTLARYGSGCGYRAIELPYDGEQLAMLFLLPDKQPLDNLEAQLSP